MHLTQAGAQDPTREPQTRSPRAMFLLLAGLLIFCFLCAFFHVSDVDVGYHIRTGEHILDGHGIPAVNTFSHSVPEQRWLIQQWLPATIYAWVHRLGGIPALTTFKALLAVVAMFLVWCCARQVVGNRSLLPVWLVTVAVLIMRVRFYERPDLFSTTFLALALFLDQRFDKDRRWQWIWLPAFMALWANTHGGYVYGFVLFCALAAAECIEFLVAKSRGSLAEARTLWIRPAGILLSVAAAAGSVQVINPSGWETLTVPFAQFFSKVWQSLIVEFFPPTWANSKLLFLWMGALAVLQAVTWRHFRMRYFVVSAGFAYFACSSQRSLSAFVVASVPHAAFMLSRIEWPIIDFGLFRRLARPLLPLTWAALVAFVIVPDRTYQFGFGLYHPYYPTEVFQFVRREVPPQNLFNDMRFGGPMLWTLYPDFKPFIDGRNDAYTEEFWTGAYLPAVNGEEPWADIFAKFEITGALLSMLAPGKPSRLAHTLMAHPDWALVAFDDDTLLFLKRTEANLSVIQQHSFARLWPGNWDLGGINSSNVTEMAVEARRALALHAGRYASAVGARCAMVGGDFRAAGNLFETVVEQPGASAAFWSDYAWCLYQSGQFTEAERALNRMIRQNMSVGFAYYLRHFIALRNREPDAARSFLAKAIASEPDNAEYRQAWQRFPPAAERKSS